MRIDVQAVLDWYRTHRRDLPWRSTTPYGVLVSEFMLQQTPVSRVLPAWNAWMEKWPDPQSLSRASRADVLRAWGGLGYPRRAIRLHESAKIIVADHGGEVPADPALLRTLPGIGEYTAAAIAAFAFAQPCLVLDINVRRLIARAERGVNAPRPTVSVMERELARALMPDANADVWAAASMELGALICTARTPACEECPLRSTCAWREGGYPVTISGRTQTWEGTDRQCRGALMRALRESPEALHGDQLQWSDPAQRERCLQELIREGLIQSLPDQYYSLPH